MAPAPQRYGKLSSGYYTGRLASEITGDPYCQALGPYLIGGPHANMIGLYRLPVAYIAEDLGWPIERAREALAKLAEAGFACVDDERRLVWVVEAARHEWGAHLDPKDNRTRSLEKHLPGLLAEAGESPLVQAFAEHYREGWACVLDGLTKPSPSPSGVSVEPSPSAPGYPHPQPQPQPQQKKARVPRDRVVDPVDEVIPPEIDTPAFRAAWAEWHSYRRESRRQAWVARTRATALAELAPLGPDAAVAAIRRAIASGWQGIHPPTGSGGSGRSARRPTWQAGAGPYPEQFDQRPAVEGGAS